MVMLSFILWCFRVKLSSADSLTLMQDTRLIQLDTAIQMELWQEAYRSAEDVHGMMQLSKDKDRKMVKPASYVNYYDKVVVLPIVLVFVSVQIILFFYVLKVDLHGLVSFCA